MERTRFPEVTRAVTTRSNPVESTQVEQLVEEAKEGNQRAFESLVRQTYADTYTLAFRLVGNEEDARDVVQETYLRAHKGLKKFRGDAQLSTWLHRITMTVVLNGLRGVRRFRARETDLELGDRAVHEEQAIEPDLKQRLYEAIDALPDHHRAVFVMHEIEGYKHEEIAEVMEIKVGTSKSHLHRARAALRDTLSDFAAEWAS